MTPDSGAVVPGLRDPLVIQFDEVISEAAGGGLHRLIELSPRPSGLKVSWKRTAVAVAPADGWRPGTVYHVRLHPGITDLRNNQLTESRMIIFSTGDEIPPTRLSGVVLDWEAHRPARSALVEAVLLPDSLEYVARADSGGAFDLTALPRGRYTVLATVDANTNGRRDPREGFDSVSVTLDSVASHVFWTYARDTLGPQLRSVVRLDSVTVRLEFSHTLAPQDPEAGSVSVRALPDSTPLPVQAVWRAATYDSIRDVEGAEGAERARGPEPDTSQVARLLTQRPRLGREWVARLREVLAPGSRYLVEAEAEGMAGARARSRAVLIVPAARDST